VKKRPTQKALFERLGAPLANWRWSWGGVRKDGAIVLRVWKDSIRTEGSRTFVRVLRAKWRHSGATELGARERAQHVEQICKGTPCYLVMCEADDTAARPRRIMRFNAQAVFPGGTVKEEVDGDVWVELRPAVSVENLATRI
jgi:hypothetical protein